MNLFFPHSLLSSMRILDKTELNWNNIFEFRIKI